MILKFLALSLQHVSLTFSGEISLFRSHKKNKFYSKSGFQVHNDNVTVSYGSRAPPGPGGGAYSTPAKLPSWILRDPTSKERIDQRRKGNKEEGRRGMEERGREERGGEERGEEGGERISLLIRRDGSPHPLEFSKVGAYGSNAR